MSQFTDYIKQSYNSTPTAKDTYNAVPFDLVTSSYQGIPLVTYGTLLLTTGILAYVTYAEKGPINEGETEEKSSVIPNSFAMQSLFSKQTADQQETEEDIEQEEEKEVTIDEPTKEAIQEPEPRPISGGKRKKTTKRRRKLNRTLSNKKK
jgi:hypothetical protein